MDDRNETTEGKGLAQSTADAVKKIKRIKTLAAIIGPALPTIGIVLLIILATIIVFLPIIATYDFTGGVFNSSTTNNESLMMGMNLEGFSKEDAQIFTTINEEREKYKNLDFKKDSSEELDLALLISTIQNQGIVNFDNSIYDMVKENEEKLSSFESIEDFNKYVDKYTSSDTEKKEYKGESIVDNDQNRAYYNNLKDKGGNVYYIYPGNRKLLGYMVYNDVNYSTVEYDRWPCEGSADGWCDNADEIWSDWRLLRSITSNNGDNASCGGSGNAMGAICNIRAGLSYAEGYNGNSNSWEYKNIKYDLKQLRKEVLGGSDSDDISQVMKDLSGDSEARIPNGNFSVGVNYVTVNVKKNADYDLYEEYAEDVFIKHLYLDCDNCEMKNDSDEMKKKKASTIYDNIYNIKTLFDYFNDETAINSNISSGSATIPGVSYNCGEYYTGISADYKNHRANDLTSSAPNNPNIYPLFEGEVVKIVNTCINICPNSDAHLYINGTPLSSLSSACQCGGGWGNHVQIKGTYNGRTIYAIYAHLSSVNVSLGQKVTYDTVLGAMGNTGVSTGRHLHIELSYTGGSSDKFPATQIFSKDTVLGTLCKRNFNSGGLND